MKGKNWSSSNNKIWETEKKEKENIK